MRALSLIMCFLFVSQVSYASTGLKDVLDNYHYNVTVEWDQKNSAELEKYEAALKSDIDRLIQEGHSPEAIVNEAISLLKDESLKSDIVELIAQKKNQSLSKEELVTILQDKSESIHAKGASWNAVTKVIVGVVVTYVVLKALMLTIYYWDYEPVDCSVQDCSPPHVEDKN